MTKEHPLGAGYWWSLFGLKTSDRRGRRSGGFRNGCIGQHVHPIEENLSMTTKHSTGNSTNNRTKRSSYLFLPPRDASSQDKASEASGSKNRSGFTLVELMVAMCVSLMLLGGVVSLFGTLGESVNDSKSNSEMLQTMRHASRQLQSDLGNVSLVPDPAQTHGRPSRIF